MGHDLNLLPLLCLCSCHLLGPEEGLVLGVDLPGGGEGPQLVPLRGRERGGQGEAGHLGQEDWQEDRRTGRKIGGLAGR